MCGITGKLYFNHDKNVMPDEIKRMTDKLSHRGPDDEGIFLNGNIGLGHRRLSILDLSSAGHQPMPDKYGKVHIVFNGEIYNFLELKKELEKDGIVFHSKTDTEVIIYLYEKYGPNCVKMLNGMFTFAIWDAEKRHLFLARDHIGKKPLKYYFDNNCFIFASELKAILENPEVKKEIDFEAIDEYLTYQYVPAPKTGFKNIYKLEPAHYMIVKENGEMVKKRYWDLDFSEKPYHSEKEWEEIIIKKLRDSVKRRLISDVSLGAHLSGGIDSSLIVALMSQELKDPVKTFSIGFREKDYNELGYASLVAKRYKTDHHEFIVKPQTVEILPEIVRQYEEPFADSSALPTWYLSEMTKKYVTVALNGDGGDENFAGYGRYTAMNSFRFTNALPWKQEMKKISSKLYKATGINLFEKTERFIALRNNNASDFYLKLVKYFEREEKDSLYADSLKEKTKNSRWYSFMNELYNFHADYNWLDKALYTDINSYLPEDLLVKVDIASMAHALEVRSPFLDHEFMELTAKMQSNLKVRLRDRKYLIKKIAYGYIPKECIDRPKRGFGVPLKHWFKNELGNYLKYNLLDKDFLDFGFKKEGLEKLIQDHEKLSTNNTNRLWALLTLSIWLKTWFK